MTSQRWRPLAGRVLLGTSLILIAFNMRPVFTSLPVLLPEIMADTGMSALVASLMTTLPVLCLGVFAFVAPRLAWVVGAERTILACLVLATLGVALRWFASVPALLASAALAGAGIAVLNVLLPGMVKRDFAQRGALMTGLYTMAISAGAATGGLGTVPLYARTGEQWAHALALWAVPLLAVVLLWAPQAARRSADVRAGAAPPRSLWRQPLAWQVTIFMGLQSSLAYCLFAWFAPILRARGLSQFDAAFLLSVSIALQTAACLLVPAIATRRRDQRAINVVLIALAVIGYLGCMLLPLSTVWIWAVVQGIGQGGLLAVAMTLLLLRSGDAQVAAQLSGMSQGVGYLLAALGPVAMGLIWQVTGDFRWTAVFLAAVGVAAAAAGIGAGRNLQLPGASPAGPGDRPAAR